MYCELQMRAHGLQAPCWWPAHLLLPTGASWALGPHLISIGLEMSP
jgi:hypothetical protein